jgi:FkbM family methyltransferase
MKFYSQDGQDEFLCKLFKNKKGGFFLDIGAYDGIKFSNTYFMEKSLGWNGICVEPNPKAFEELNKNRNCICLNCCVSESKGKFEFLSISGYGVMLSGLLNFLDPQHLQRIDDSIRQFGGSKTIIDLPSFRVETILEEHKITEVDYCNIDVEGGEMSVLKSIDFSKINIRVFTIENNYSSKEINSFLKRLGYKKIARLGADEIYELNSRRYALILLFKYRKAKEFVASISKKILKY